MTLQATPALLGRTSELAVLDRRLDEARSGRGNALVVRGEAGIGKSALLSHASTADDVLVLRGGGIETEVKLPFAGLHLLLREVLGELDSLPNTHARALRCALGTGNTGTGEASELFAIGLAVLALFERLARQRPVVCVIDDAHWLDESSADALLFAARRLSTERVLLLFAARELHAPPFPAPGLAELRLDGLASSDVDTLLREYASDLPRHVRDRVAEDAAGNPLAVLEFAAAQREGRPVDPYGVARLPAHSRIQRTFADRIAALPDSTRTVLLVAAADGTCNTGTVLEAATRLGASAADLRVAEGAELLMFTDNCIGFPHPLVRTAAYQKATMQQRIAAHRALAETSAEHGEADRRAWHLAAASTGPDEAVASALEAGAEHARARGGYGAVASAYERAAQLSPDTGERGRRLTAAARAAAEAGQLQRACQLAHEAGTLLSDPVAIAWAAMIHATIAEDHAKPLEAQRILARAAESVAGREPDLAGKLLFWSGTAAWSAGDARAVAGTAADAEALGLPDTGRFRSLATASGGDVAEAMSAVRDLIADSERLPRVCTDQPIALRRRSEIAGWHLLLGDHLQAHELALGIARDSRQQSAAGVLPRALALLARTELLHGDPAAARANAEEGRRIAADIGQPQGSAELAGVLALLAATEGDQRRSTALAGEAFEPQAALALSLLDLGNGDYDAALDRLAALAPAPDRLATIETVPIMVEAAARAGRSDEVSGPVVTFLTWAERSATPWARAVALRCRAVLGESHLFAEAIELHHSAPGRPFERARTELLYGEWLRRERHRSQARARLRSALTIFERLGARPWAERARTELRATGESLGAKAHAPELAERLTPQELRIVRLAATGLSNRDIGSRLFLSPRTVGYHLYKAYPKLGVASRVELAKLGLAS
ncbi:helix-turn-helix transcriptional regulator [Prauserella cavernicola]|uniref:AAA family ATPase n=1 Tax=Prauserella cavernicola TaxID=2800127 RepID=A0A934V266_9PSEU|nr:LuxR family transcriptional regulator [Prauserella cavernicola]MBK1784871.1 AAA family ATPase [Prauserella cavernicola]